VIKQIRVVNNGRANGQAFEAFSWDGGRSFCSDPKATLAFLRRRKAALDVRLSERELRWLDQLDSEPEFRADSFGIRCAVKFQG
jgi:hypothetical protein